VAGKRPPAGRFRSTCRIPGNLLAEGDYAVTVLLWSDGYTSVCKADSVVEFRVYDTPKTRGDFLARGWALCDHGLMAVGLSWDAQRGGPRLARSASAGCAMIRTWVHRDFMPFAVTEFLLETETVLDIGCGIGPQSFFRPQVAHLRGAAPCLPGTRDAGKGTRLRIRLSPLQVDAALASFPTSPWIRSSPST